MQSAQRKSHKFNSLQVLRGLAALGVVYYHMGYYAKRHLGLYYNGAGADYGNLGVDCFFVLSGFIICWMHFDDLGHPEKFGRYISKRVIRIYPLLWLIVLTKVIACLLVPALLVTLKIEAQTVVASFFSYPSAHYILDVQWTLTHEVLFYGIFGLWMCLGRLVAGISAGLWILMILTLKNSTGNVWLDYFLAERNLEFLVGCLAAIMMRHSFLPWRAAAVAATVALLCLVVGLFFGWKHPLFWGFTFSGFIIGAVSLDWHVRLQWPRVLIYIGNASYSIYLLHTSVLMISIMIGRKAGLSFEIFGQSILHLAVLVSVLCGLICYRFVEMPTLHMLNSRFRRPADEAPKASGNSGPSAERET